MKFTVFVCTSDAPITRVKFFSCLKASQSKLIKCLMKFQIFRFFFPPTSKPVYHRLCDCFRFQSRRYNQSIHARKSKHTRIQYLRIAFWGVDASRVPDKLNGFDRAMFTVHISIYICVYSSHDARLLFFFLVPFCCCLLCFCYRVCKNTYFV